MIDLQKVKILAFALVFLLAIVPVDLALSGGGSRDSTQKPANKQPQRDPKFVETSAYQTRQVEGWRVHVNRILLDEKSELGEKALRLLRSKLHDIRRTVPAQAVKELVKVPIWLGVEGGHPRCAAYHPGFDWLRNNGFNTDKAKSVEISNAQLFLDWSTVQPAMVLHELAHAYHDQILSWQHEKVKQAYQAAVKSGSYDSVLHYSGRVKKAYAMSNAKEYFAEATEAYFSTNDFYPFVRPELRRHDPQMMKVLEEVWKVKAPGKPNNSNRFSWKQGSHSLALMNNGKTVWQFNYHPDEAKPYFHPVALVDGTVLTWLKPADHIWHRALWFSWKYINGVNYWEENDTAKGRTEVARIKLSPREDHSASITMVLDYHPEGEKTVLTEKRIIEISAPDAKGRYHLDWDCTFTAQGEDVVLDRSPSVKKDGSPAHGGYAGLSARLAEDLTEFEILNSAGQRDLDTHSGPARWLDFSGRMPTGGFGGIAMFDHPGNLRHPISWWISKMWPEKNKHNYCASPLYHEAYTINAGKSLNLKYRVLCHPGRGDKKNLDSQWRDYANK